MSLCLSEGIINLAAVTLKDIAMLFLRGTEIIDVTPLEQLRSLRALYIEAGYVTDLGLIGRRSRQRMITPDSEQNWSK
jgi:hypothetical protein